MIEQTRDTSSRIEELQAILSAQPDDVDSRIALANLYFSTGKMDSGAECYRGILGFDQSAPAYTLVGSALLTANRLVEAVNCLEVAQQLAPDSPETAGELGLAYLRQGRPEDARLLIQRGLAASPESEELRLALAKCDAARGEYWEAIHGCAELLDSDPIDEQSPLLLMGDCFIAVGGIEEANRCYSAAVELEPLNSAARVGLVHLHLSLGKDSEAESVVNDGLALDEDDPQLHAAMGHIQMHRQDWNAAVECFRKALGLDSEYVPAYGPLASVYLLMDNPEVAARVAEEGLMHNPENVECLLTAAQAAELIAEYQRAVDMSLRAIALQPDNFLAHLICGRSQLQTNENIPAAREHIEQAQRLAPDAAFGETIAKLLSQIPDNERTV
jgi:tetratricopeptide (TPR) repeat protein